MTASSSAVHAGLSASEPSDGQASSARLQSAEARFAAALTRLEGGVSHAVHQVAELARRTGWEDGHSEGRREGYAEGFAEGAASVAPVTVDDGASRDEVLALREALAASRQRERDLAEALAEAQSAIHAAVAEIRAYVGGP
jgi:flagellar biosynthesis/type III secretory pathway protein FliH